ncbi:hypothetical protein [Agilicoccus flavus]|uniref:hypothetical protein n=1 Tax=Agilicoccus flavus TaxID=2775968 RepID=UPI001CF6B3DD|nr:hypothetical protein [Agilicoccus flavus]
MIVRRSSAVAAALLTASLASAAPASAQPAGPSTGTRATSPSAVPTAPCLDARVGLSVEERRLSARLPDPADPSRLAGESFAAQMVAGGGFGGVAPRVVRALCEAGSPAQARRLAQREGARLWAAAVARAQSRGRVAGALPRSDDRPLYWTRLQVSAALRQWSPRFALTSVQRAGLIEAFEKASRGMTDVRFPAGGRTTRVMVSGFDPYTLDGGDAGTASGAAGNNIRHGNPSGATALALDGTVRRGPDGRRQVVQAYLLPVNYTEFAQGWIEDTVGPWMRPGRRSLDASITLSQGREGRFDLEVWNGRYHGVSAGNDGSHPCPAIDGVPQLATDNPGCNTTVPARWNGRSVLPTASAGDPPQWTTSSLPAAAMIAGRTGRGLTPPPGATWTTGQGFRVVRNTTFTEFPDCAAPQRVTRNEAATPDGQPPQPGTPPASGSCAYSGGGGTYLSNESAYRNTLLRDRLGRRIPAGHIHTPVMQHFAEGNRYAGSDASFDAWRQAIVAQTARLVHVVADRA